MQPHLIHHHHRRASLGLAVYGPFSRNRRRRGFREATPAVIAAALLLSVLLFLTALFA